MSSLDTLAHLQSVTVDKVKGILCLEDYGRISLEENENFLILHLPRPRSLHIYYNTCTSKNIILCLQILKIPKFQKADDFHS